MVIDLVRVTNRTRVITLQIEWAKSLTTLNDVLKFDPRNRALATQMQDSELLQNPEPVRKFQWRRDPKFFVKGPPKLTMASAPLLQNVDSILPSSILRVAW